MYRALLPSTHTHLSECGKEKILCGGKFHSKDQFPPPPPAKRRKIDSVNHNTECAFPSATEIKREHSSVPKSVPATAEQYIAKQVPAVVSTGWEAPNPNSLIPVPPFPDCPTCEVCGKHA